MKYSTHPNYRSQTKMTTKERLPEADHIRFLLLLGLGATLFLETVLLMVFAK